MEMGEQPRHQVAADNEEKQVAASGTRLSLFAIVVGVVIAVAVFGWFFAR